MTLTTSTAVVVDASIVRFCFSIQYIFWWMNGRVNEGLNEYVLPQIIKPKACDTLVNNLSKSANNASVIKVKWKRNYKINK